MKKNIKIDYQAKLDLAQIYNYISKDSKFYAKKTIYEISKRINYLLIFPEMGKIIDTNKSARQIIYKSYKILYIFDSKNIYILRIIHTSRDISNLKF